MKPKHLKIITSILLIFIIGITSLFISLNSKTKLKSVSSQTQLKKLYDGDDTFISQLMIAIPTMPWSYFFSHSYYYSSSSAIPTEHATTSTDTFLIENSSSAAPNNVARNTSSKDYSTTNIQVENVDEADITKTDGDYIYSLSDNNVIITNVQDSKNIKIASKISIVTGTPEDLILYNNKLAVISEKGSYSENNTIVDIYNIEDKEHPTKVKNYELFEPYYTSRCIGNKLYVISSGSLREESDKIVTYYNEDNQQTELELKKIQYLKDVDSRKQTLISTVNLDSPTEPINLQSYLIDISNAYVSENNIYLLNKKNSYINIPPISSLFGLKGVFGFFAYLEGYYNNNSTSNYETEIYKFNIQNDGTIQYNTKTKIDGQTINQFSLDEYNNTLRVALYDNNGSKVVVFDNELNKIGETSYLAKGEKMYSSRFIGNKAYLITYKTLDPLYVIDLSSPTSPTVLGELKIPGYSTYLHPYDEDHLIGIGMETKEITNRNTSGKVISTTSKITGMKMALFDVSNVSNTTQISNTIIGDSRTTSAILTNHKALLFSKEKELLAIPVNNYAEDFEITDSSNEYSSTINSYTNYNKEYLSEGYLVYNINLNDGFTLKGKITHETSINSTSSYNIKTRLLRGLYIEDNLFTISEDLIKVNRLDNLKLINTLNIKTGTTTNAQKFDIEEEN